MINKVTYKDEPTLFDNITEYSVDELMEHRRGSNFFREDIIEFTEEHKEDFPEIENFEKYVGTWRTNNVIWDSEYGWDDKFSSLSRVKQVEKVTYEWIDVK